MDDEKMRSHTLPSTFATQMER